MNLFSDLTGYFSFGPAKLVAGEGSFSFLRFPAMQIFDELTIKHIEILKALVRRGINIRESGGRALIQASEAGNLPAVRLLIALGSDVRAQHDKALRSASENGDLEIVKALVRAGASVSSLSFGAFIRACTFGRVEVAKYLVSMGSNIQAQDNQAICKASENGHLEVVKFLVEYSRMGEIFSLVSARDNTPLIEASENKHMPVVRYLIANSTTERNGNVYLDPWAALDFYDSYVFRRALSGRNAKVADLIDIMGGKISKKHRAIALSLKRKAKVLAMMKKLI